MASKPGVLGSPSGSVWRVPAFLARWCPAWRRSDPGLRLRTEREKASVETATEGVVVARRRVPTAETGGIEYRSRRSLADRPVVAVKPLLAGVAVERGGRLTRNVHFGQPGREPWEEARRTCQSPRTSRLRFPSSWSGRRTGGLRPTRVPREWTGRR